MKYLERFLAGVEEPGPGPRPPACTAEDCPGRGVPKGPDMGREAPFGTFGTSPDGPFDGERDSGPFPTPSPYPAEMPRSGGAKSAKSPIPPRPETFGTFGTPESGRFGEEVARGSHPEDHQPGKAPSPASAKSAKSPTVDLPADPLDWPDHHQALLADAIDRLIGAGTYNEAAEAGAAEAIREAHVIDFDRALNWRFACDLSAGPTDPGAFRPLVPYRRAGPDHREFDQETIDLREWLRELIESGEADRLEPFTLGPGVRVSDPGRFARALLLDLATPSGPRSRSGVARSDLEQFDNLTRAQAAGPGTEIP